MVYHDQFQVDPTIAVRSLPFPLPLHTVPAKHGMATAASVPSATKCQPATIWEPEVQDELAKARAISFGCGYGGAGTVIQLCHEVICT